MNQRIPVESQLLAISFSFVSPANKSLPFATRNVAPSAWHGFLERVARLYEPNAPQEEILQRIRAIRWVLGAERGVRFTSVINYHTAGCSRSARSRNGGGSSAPARREAARGAGASASCATPLATRATASAGSPAVGFGRSTIEGCLAWLAAHVDRSGARAPRPTRPAIPAPGAPTTACCQDEHD
jgi:hypothetical protein